MIFDFRFFSFWFWFVDFWFLVFGFWFLVFGFWFLVFGFWFLVFIFYFLFIVFFFFFFFFINIIFIFVVQEAQKMGRFAKEAPDVRSKPRQTLTSQTPWPDQGSKSQKEHEEPRGKSAWNCLRYPVDKPNTAHLHPLGDY